MAHMDGTQKQKKFSKKSKPVWVYKKKESKREVYLEEVEKLKERYEQIDDTSFERFDHLPLSSHTLEGLRWNKYEKLTDIQRESIVLALKGHDILGAAKTGSGKTLAFVVPVLECLFREGWSRPAGLGALVITPTRELAYQIYEVFNKVGRSHGFTIALVIGGKDLAIERKVLNQYNIVICTPGRLLQHMDENPLFDAVTLQILVLDEADRILDFGFAKTMNAIIENLPPERQTLLFSATQTKSVKDLARLSLKDPKYVSAHEHAACITPESLIQSYVVCEAHDKINFLWSFLKRHKKQKILVFMATCKQVRYTFDAFCRLRPGISVTALYGRLHQLKRMSKYNDFCRKQSIVMFATDVAARGLDFPSVNWVVHLDCPEDVNTYIHRAGRTARYQEGGESVLVLLPSEKESMIKQLEAKKIPINEIEVNDRELQSITKKMEMLCSQDENLKFTAQRAFTTYLKSIYLMKDKTVFDVHQIDLDAYARSLGLLITPRTRFINKQLKIQQKPQLKSNVMANNHRTTAPGNKDADAGWNLSDSSDEGEDNVLNPLRTYEIEEEKNEVEIPTNRQKKPVTKAAAAKKILKKGIMPNTKIVFGDDGEVVGDINKAKAPLINEITSEILKEGYSIERAKRLMAEADKVDKEEYRKKIKEKHKIKKMKLKEAKQRKSNVAPEHDDEDYSEEDTPVQRDSRAVREAYIRDLPDPDQYSSQDSEKSDDDDDDDDDDTKQNFKIEEPQFESVENMSEAEQPKQNKKRKKKKLKESSHKRPKLAKELPTTIGFDVDEDLVLGLLQNS